MVIAHGPWPLVVFAPDRTRDGPSVVLYLHVNDSGGWLDRLAHRVSVDGIVANSNFTATVGRRGWRASPVWVCRYPVPEPPPVDRSVVREELRLAESDVAILQVSRFQEWKGQLLHLAALHRLPRELPWRAFLVGGASRPSEIELRSKVLKLASALPNGKFTLLGERSDVPRLMRAADIFCQPNTGPEPFGLVFVEALWAGVPVVTTRMGGAVEIIDDSCGRLCGADPESVAAALEALVRSADLRHSLGREGPTRAARLCSSDEALRELKATLKAVKERRTAAREMSWA
jgi:glycosyltransferase involved in cell wall biosynthesis